MPVLFAIWTEEYSAITGLLLSNLLSAYLLYRSQNRKDRRDAAEVDGERDDGVIAAWQVWGRQQAKERSAERLRGDKLMEEQSDLYAAIARQTEVINNLKNEIQRLTSK